MRHIDLVRDKIVHFCLHIMVRIFIDEGDTDGTMVCQSFQRADSAVTSSDNDYMDAFHCFPQNFCAMVAEFECFLNFS